MKKSRLNLAVYLCLASLWQSCTSVNRPSNFGMENPKLRAEWETMLLADPATGKIPVTRAQELAFAKDLPSEIRSHSRTDYYDWTARGPYNFGGRTRGAALDLANDSIVIAGSVSGHIYKSINQGGSWYRVTSSEQTWGITCLTQDPRNGKTNQWYAGSGEDYNSASQGAAARFVGNGILKSTDNGESWFSLASTQSGTPQSLDYWDRIWRVKVNPAATTDQVYAAVTGRIMRSNDGGQNWIAVLGGSGANSYYSDIEFTSTGVAYATLSSEGATKGIYRSEDGQNWVNILPAGFPSNYGRIVLGINPSNESEVYFLAETPNRGKRFENFRGDVEWISFWKYSYINGDGSGAGGFWEDRSANLPRGPYKFDDLNIQGGYDMLIAVKPNDENTVIIGGTNLFRSTTAFADSTHTTFIGGYEETTDLPDFQIYENHHPDQHLVFFLPSNPDVLFSCNDGGIQRTNDILATPVVWQSLNNGYNTTQFYAVALDHATSGSSELMGGLQDNGTFYTNNADPFDWKFPFSYDGGYSYIADGGSMHLASIQLGRMFKLAIDANGNRTGFRRFDPIGGSGYSFIHAWTMDPVDNSIVYLPLGSNLWRNDKVDEIVVDNSADSISFGWSQFTGVIQGSGSCAGVSTTNPPHRVYVGTSGGNCLRVDNANSASPTFTNVGNFSAGSGYLNCIAVDPENGDHALAIFSNYNVHSIHFTEDGGQTWYRAGGNLEAANAPENAPADLYNISTAPSVRWGKILNVNGEKVYLVGTSVGLFGTRSLAYGTNRQSDSTVWVQLGKETIGNSIVMMIDARESDDYVAVATHGSGIFAAHIPHSWGVTGLGENNSNKEADIFPNPVHENLTLRFEIFNQNPIALRIFDMQGRKVKQENLTPFAENAVSAFVGDLKAGTYLAVFNQGNAVIRKKFVVTK